jgi:hypothetical protein
MTHFDEMGRRIGWSEIEFSHRLSPEHGLGGVNDGGGQRLAWRKVPYHCGLVRVRGQRYGWGCRDGFEDVFFH